MPWTTEAQEGEGMGSMPKPGMELKYSKQPRDIGVGSPSHAYITGHATCDLGECIQSRRGLSA